MGGRGKEESKSYSAGMWEGHLTSQPLAGSPLQAGARRTGKNGPEHHTWLLGNVNEEVF